MGTVRHRSGLRRAARALLVLVALGLVAVVGTLALAHAAIRRERAALPAVDEVRAALGVGEHPNGLSIAHTASQEMPRSGVLDPARDPAPDARYVMAHPSFVLGWADGRILLVDAGMDRAGALAFGRPIELVSGGRPIEPGAPVVEQLGGAADRVDGVVFTHLHTDHVGGIEALCRARTRPLRVFMTAAQDERGNYTTRPGRTLLRDVRLGAGGKGAPSCVEIVRVEGPLAALPGFPGAFVIDAGGHTPGSQIVLAAVSVPEGTRAVSFPGDTVNHTAGIDADVPKPFLYRLLVVPEDEERQGELRRFLRALREDAGVQPLVSHDRLALDASGFPAYAPPAP